MKAKKNTGQAGFTLIETLMAMAIFTIGILGLFGMQTAVIKKNLAANSITTGATWATDRVEMLLGQDYEQFVDIDDDRCAGLDDRQPASAGNPARADGNDASGTIPNYNIYWNVASNCNMATIPDAPTEDQEQKPKHIRVIVTVDRLIGERELAVFDYIKQNVDNNN